MVTGVHHAPRTPINDPLFDPPPSALTTTAERPRCLTCAYSYDVAATQSSGAGAFVDDPTSRLKTGTIYLEP